MESRWKIVIKTPKVLNLALISLLIISQVGCITSDSISAEEPGDTSTQAEKDLVMSSNQPVSPDSVIYWQSFFKPPPTSKEKMHLESQLRQWSSVSDPDQLLLKARSQIAVGQKKEAESTLLYLVRKAPDHLEGSLELANLFLHLEQLPEALTTLGNIQELMGRDRKVSPEFLLKYRYTLGLCKIAVGDRQEGHNLLGEIIGDFPLFAPAYSALAQSYLDMDNPRLAEFVVQRALDRIKNQPNLFNLAGALAMQDSQEAKAKDFFDLALKIDPKFAPALVNRAILSFKNLEYSAAEEDLLIALKVDPMNSDTLATYGILQMRLGNYDVSKSAFIQSIDTKPNHAFSRYNLAVLYFDHLNRPDEARRLLTEVLNIKSAPKRLKALSEQYLSRLKNLQSAY